MSIYAMQDDVGRSKLREGLEMQKDINEAVAESVGAMFAKELGKQKFVEAEKMEEQVVEEKATGVATLFVDDMAESKKRQAAEKEAQEKRAQEERIMESLKGAGAKTRFRAFLKAGKMNEAKIEAAKMLQNSWRGKLAKRKMEKKRQEKQRLREEAGAIKLQGRWRIKKSREKVRKLKEQQQRLREEGAAIMLQSSWRIRKANEKVKRLKIEKRRLMEEGAAMMFQSAWRRRQAVRRVGGLRTKKRVEGLARDKIGHFALRYLAKIKYLKKKRQAIQIILVTLISAEGLTAADVTGSSDPYVLIQGIHLDRDSVSVSNPVANKSSRSVVSQPMGKKACLYKSQIVYKTLNPTWNESCMIPGINGYDDITLTLCDYDMVGAHDFLGQVLLIDDYQTFISMTYSYYFALIRWWFTCRTTIRYSKENP
jgi:C2 domain/IQ calmodulin-binding motif